MSAKKPTRYKDKISIVTGGGGGIGREICLFLGRWGAEVIVTGKRLETCEAVADEIFKDAGKAEALQLDVTRCEDVQRAIDRTVSKYGRIDFMFNNAGINIAGEVRDLNPADWLRVMDVNFNGMIYGTMAAYHAMIRQGYGHIVNISSLAGLLPFPANANYSATKHAIIGLTTTLRVEARALGIDVSVVCPGIIATDLWKKTPIRRADNDDIINMIPVRMMSPEKAARKILDGVARNRGIIVFPLHARALWWLYRVSPEILTPVFKKLILDFRKARYSEAQRTFPVHEYVEKGIGVEKGVGARYGTLRENGVREEGETVAT